MTTVTAVTVSAIVPAVSPITEAALEAIESAKKALSLEAELTKQFKEEYGTEELPAHRARHRSTPLGARLYDSGCTGCRANEDFQILRQKYGLATAQLTDKERKVVAREERRRLGDALMRS